MHHLLTLTCTCSIARSIQCRVLLVQGARDWPALALHRRERCQSQDLRCEGGKAGQGESESTRDSGHAADEAADTCWPWCGKPFHHCLTLRPSAHLQAHAEMRGPGHQRPLHIPGKSLHHRLCLGRFYREDMESSARALRTAMCLPPRRRGAFLGSSHSGQCSKRQPWTLKRIPTYLRCKAFHDTGRYILSAGHDQVINLVSRATSTTSTPITGIPADLTQWVVPEILPQHMEAPIVVHYPHFFTSDIHNSLVDW